VSSRPTAPGRAAFVFVFVFITATLDMLALGIISPVLPGLIVEFEGGNVSDAAKVVGWFGFVWATMQFFAAPVLGVLSDRFGRRPVILLSMAGMGLDYILMGVAPSLAWLLVGRIISGLTSATHPVAAAYIADVTPPEQRSARFGILGASFGLGFVIGPAIGGLLGSIDLRLPFWGAAALCLANAAFGVFVLPESLPLAQRVPFTWRRANPFGALALLRSHPELKGLSVSTILITFAHAALPNVIVLYMGLRYGWGERAIGLAITAIGASSAVVGLLLIGPVVKRLGDRATLLAGLAFGAAGFLFYAFAARAELFVVGIAVMSLWGLANGPLQTFMSRRVGAHEQGQLQGAITSLRGITGMIGPPFFGWVFALSIDPAAPLHLPGAAFFIAALTLAAACLLTARITRP
jgi:DHA1 family tetracycline resistance protein-like MFS transporter